MTYKPREGDIVRITARIGRQENGKLCADTSIAGTPYNPAYFNHGILGALIAEGRVELLSRAEPDWQPGDIGQHIETGELYQYWPRPPALPWRALASAAGSWHEAGELEGKLVRCTVTPEDDA
jgi:hypothetical protein